MKLSSWSAARRLRHGAGVATLVLVLLCTSSAATTPSWTQLPDGPPLGRHSATGVYDPGTNTMILFGGTVSDSTSGVRNEVWHLGDANGAGTPAWSQVAVAAGPIPAARHGHTAVHDAVTDRMIIFGGSTTIGSCGGLLNDVWVLADASGAGGTPQWTQLSVSGGPSPRRTHTAQYDPVTNTMIVIGGSPNCGNPFFDHWILHNANGLGGSPSWQSLGISGGPTTNSFHNSAYDPATNRLMVWRNSGLPKQMWIVTNANGDGTPAWSVLSTSGDLPATFLQNMVYNATANEATLFGGIDSGSRTARVYTLTNANGVGGSAVWTELAPATGPGGRNAFVTTLDAATGALTIFGGVNDTNGAPGTVGYLEDTWVLDLETPAPPPVVDADGDGLSDADEAIHGTDPNDADSDDDGLEDGAEVDLAAGSACPDPLDADSDDDGLLDGAEVTAGSDPCDADTDGDGLNDGLDPTPTTAGVPPEFLEATVEDIGDAVAALSVGSFTGKKAKTQANRQGALENKLEAVTDAIADGETADAIAKLESILKKVDGKSKPKDWISGPARAAVQADIEHALLLLELFGS